MRLFLAVFASAAFFFVFHTAHAQNFTAIDPTTLVALSNADRISNNYASLKVSPLLEKAAMKKAQDMARGEYFSHTSPAGVTPWYWFRDVGYSYAYAGENLAIDFSDSQSVEAAWMNSKLHRENILNGHYTEIGMAVLKGTYQGRETTYIVELFGKPFPAPLASKSKKITKARQVAALEPKAVKAKLLSRI